ncbi:hypothetical protein [Egicoccus sp. AB-alg6-2]|uniref:hypothetical protein n=1 Tax=Egicoccus sp. AB-alg6-2 TaxID=3242692 RepID=UPI00359D4D56
MSTLTLTDVARSQGVTPRHADRVVRRPSTAVLWRRRAVAVLGLVLIAFALTVAIGRVGAEAELADKVAGHVVVQPGESLWEVAAATAPEGVDTRRHLDDLVRLNGFDSSQVEAWTVVLLPAR